MRRLERLHALTDHLRARAPRPVPVSQLADRFAVSTRTIERDLRSLAEAGVPVYGTAGRAGGFSILPDYSMAPPRLTAQEAAACLAGLSLLDASPFASHGATALDKLMAALPEAVRAQATREPLVQIGSPSTAGTAAWIDALHEHRIVEITYLEDPTVRQVEPYTVLHAEGHWYLIGWCRHRDGVRGFRTDRITALRGAAEQFDPRHARQVAEDLDHWKPTRLDGFPL